MHYVIAFVILGALSLLILGPPKLPRFHQPPPPKKDTKEMSIKEIWEEVFKDAA